MNTRLTLAGWFRLGGGILVAALAAIPGACTPATGTVSGKVTYKGKPLTSGTVVFMGDKNVTAQSPIDSEGRYSLKIAAGPAKITVAVPTPVSVPAGQRMMDPSKMGASDKTVEKSKPSEKPVRIPAKYTDPSGTPLTYTVQSGNQEHDINLD
jgi:hypothetical protein